MRYESIPTISSASPLLVQPSAAVPEAWFLQLRLSSIRLTRSFADVDSLTADVQHGLCGPLHHPADGSVLGLHWDHLQRLLLQVIKCVWLWLEREAHVRPSSGRQLDVSVCC